MNLQLARKKKSVPKAPEIQQKKISKKSKKRYHLKPMQIMLSQLPVLLSKLIMTPPCKFFLNPIHFLKNQPNTRKKPQSMMIFYR